MANFYFEPLLNETMGQQWQRHLRERPLVRNIGDIVSHQTTELRRIASGQSHQFDASISRQTGELRSAMDENSRKQVEAIEGSTRAICGTLDSGFKLVSEGLENVSFDIQGLSHEVTSMSAMLDWRLSTLIEQKRIGNILLGNIAILLRIPDIQKERQYYTEQGVKFLSNAFADEAFYDDALNNLLKAEEIEPTDYFVLFRLGMLHLYSPKHMDFSKAESYFRKSARYAIAETMSGALRSTNALSLDVSGEMKNQETTIEDVQIQAAESYLFAARCTYLQQKFNESIELANKAFDIHPQMTEAGFDLAKYLCVSEKADDALPVLRKIIEKDKFYSIKVIGDLDIVTKEPVRNLISELHTEVLKSAQELIERCNKLITANSKLKDYVNRAEKLVSEKSYVSCRTAVEEINRKRLFTIHEYIKQNKADGKWISTIFHKPFEVELSVLEMLEWERFYHENAETVRNLEAINQNIANVRQAYSEKEQEVMAIGDSISRGKTSLLWSVITGLGAIVAFIFGNILIQSGKANIGKVLSHGENIKSGLTNLLGYSLAIGGFVVGVFVLIPVMVSGASYLFDKKKMNSRIRSVNAERPELDMLYRQKEELETRVVGTVPFIMKLIK